MSYTIRKFQPETDVVKPFDCGQADLNGFLLETDSDAPNATLYDKEFLAVTYVAVDDVTHSILAYFSLLNDKIDREFVEPTIWNRLSRKIPNAKRRSSYPSLKIGRFAVDRSEQRSGIGKELLLFIQTWYYKVRKSGCRYITVDALLGAEPFYTKCGFTRLSDPREDDETVLLFFDLKSWSQTRGT